MSPGVDDALETAANPAAEDVIAKTDGPGSKKVKPPKKDKPPQGKKPPACPRHVLQMAKAYASISL